MKRKVAAAVVWMCAGVTFAEQVNFSSVATDGVHDPQSPAMTLLQQPAEALGQLPLDADGGTDWAAALRNGLIAPRKGLTGKEKMTGTDLDIVMTKTSSEQAVKFPHRAHTEWLTCGNCHSQIFLPQKGGNFMTMAAMEKGEYCGTCHGKVAFPLTNCNRCHNTPGSRAGLK